MDCNLEQADLQAASDSGDAKQIRLAAIALAICNLRRAKADMIDRRVIGRDYVLDRINAAINDLDRERDVINAASQPFPAISKELLDQLAAAINGLETAVGRSHSAQEFALAAGALIGAAAGVAK